MYHKSITFLQTNTLVSEGHYLEAEGSSKLAKILTIVSVIIGVIWIVVVVIVVVVAAVHTSKVVKQHT